MTKDLVIYIKKNCTRCDAALKYFIAKKKYIISIIDIDKRMEAWWDFQVDINKLTGETPRNVPQIIIDNIYQGDFDTFLQKSSKSSFLSRFGKKGGSKPRSKRTSVTKNRVNKDRVNKDRANKKRSVKRKSIQSRLRRR